MIFKPGCVVSHAVATQWGAGKVLEMTDVKATIQFNDGVIRKITSSHFLDLLPADPASYAPPTIHPAPKAKAVSVTKKQKK